MTSIARRFGLMPLRRKPGRSHSGGSRKRLNGWTTRRQQRCFAAAPSGNVVPEMQRQTIAGLLHELPALLPHLERYAELRADELRDAHDRVRAAGRMGRATTRVRARLPVDILGIYVYLPDVAT